MESPQLLYYYQNRDRVLKQRAEYYAQNKEMINTRSSKYFQQYYEDNKEKIIEKSTKRQITHREQCYEYKRKWTMAKLDKIQSYHLAYYKRARNIKRRNNVPVRLSNAEVFDDILNELNFVIDFE